ncbi:MAG TPA: homoserine O-acetyltransferase [Planctomycetota bacterium]|nr:homoserine O-acetyltransferase [Planctomycetota bacterium]
MPGRDLETLFWTCPDPFRLEGGEVLPCVRLAYETWGTLDAARRNVVVILHALSGSSHAFSSSLNPEPGWWEGLINDGSPLDPREHFIVCANLLGGCYGSTGPASVDPRTGSPYAASYPQITTGDMIETLRALLERLGALESLTLVGGSLGGMLALEWAVAHPREVRNAIALVSPGRSTPQAIAFRSVQREAILIDPGWNGGRCYDGSFPSKGLSLARKIGMIVYRSAREFEERFRRDKRDERLHFLEGSFEVQSYLEHQGRKFCDRFDPNTYLYFSRAMDLYDLARGHGSLEAAASRVEARVLHLAVDSDFLVPVEEVRLVHDALVKCGKDSRFEVIHSMHGHDAFLIEIESVRGHLARFLEG